MSRQDDLEHLIRDSYDIVRQYEEIVQTSDRPEEVQRARHRIEEQWGLMREPLVEYLALCRRRNLPVPEDVGEMAATFGPELEQAVAAYRPTLLPLSSRRGWVYVAVVAAVVLIVGIVGLLVRSTWLAVPAPTVTVPPPTETPTAIPPTPTATPVFGSQALYRVAIANFDRKAAREIEIPLRLEADLQKTLRSYGLADQVAVAVLPDVTIGTQEKAQEFASSVGSDVLIWGWYDDLGIRLYVLLGEQARTAAPAAGLRELPLGAADDTDQLSFYVHDVLPSNTTFLSMFVIGHLYGLSNRYVEGHRAFDAAMANIPDTVAVENEALPYFFNARLMQTAPYTDPLPIACEYARAIQLDPGLFEAYNNLGVLMMQHQEESLSAVAGAEPCVQAAGLSSLEPADLFRQALQVRPGWALAQYNVAVLDWNSATQEYRDEAGLIRDSQAAFEAVLKADPTIVGAHIWLGNLAVFQDDLEQAVERFSAARDLWPQSPEVWVNLGQALALAGRDEEASAAYHQALLLAPEGSAASLEAHLALGNLYHRQGQVERAGQEYRAIEPFAADQDSSFQPTFSLTLAKYEIDTGALISATQRLEDRHYGLAPFVLWLVRAMQGTPEAENVLGWYGDTFCWAPLYVWSIGDSGQMTLCELLDECPAGIPGWGTEPAACLPEDPAERLEAIYARFQRHVHDRLFFNKEAFPMTMVCPFVFTYDPYREGWFPDTTILYKLAGPEAERMQARPLARFDGRLWLRELEPETSYVDRLYVRVLTAAGRWLALVPDDPVLAAGDGDYLVLHQGDGRLLEFEVPPGALPVGRAWVVAEGYYVLDNVEE